MLYTFLRRSFLATDAIVKVVKVVKVRKIQGIDRMELENNLKRFRAYGCAD